MKKALATLAVILVLLGLVVLLAPPMAGTYVAGRIAEAVREETGHELAFEGLDLSVFPSIRMTAERVVLRGAPGSEAPPLLTLGPTEMEAATMPLLSGTLDVRRLEVEGVRAHLRVDGQGNPNWQAREGGEAPAPPDRPGQDPEEGAGFADIRFRNVRLSEVAVTYEDQLAGRSIMVTDGRFGLRAPGLDATAEIEGQATVNGRPVELAGSIGSPRALMQGRPTTATAQFDAAGLIAASLDLAPTEGERAAGRVQASVPDVAAVLAWLDMPANAQTMPQAIDLEAELRLADGVTEIGDLSLRADDMTAQGHVTVDMRGARPKLQGAVDLSEIRLDRYLPAEPPSAPGQPGGMPARGPDGGEPLPWDALRQVDAAFAVTAEGVAFREDRIGRTRLDLRLENGVLEARLDGQSVLGGQVQASVTADAGSSRLAVAADLDGIRFAPLVTRFSEMRLAEGSATGEIDLEARGRTRAELLRSVEGRAKLAASGQGMRIPRPNRPLEIDRFAVTLDMPSEAGPLTLAGDASLAGKPVTVNLDVARPTDLAGGAASPVVLDIGGGLGTARFRGDVAGPDRVSGQLALDIPSLPDLADRSGGMLPPGLPVARVRYEGGLRTEPGSASLQEFVLALDEAEARGTASADWSGAVPGIVARIALSPLDLDRLLPDRPDARPPGSSAPGAAGPPSDWSDEPIGFDALRKVDLDAVVESAGLAFDDVRLGPSTIRATLKGGVLAVESAQVPVFDGQADIALRIDATRSPAATALVLKAEGARAEEILAALAGNELVTGDTELSVDVSATGDSQRALVSTLDGTTTLHLRNGTLRGINVAAILRDPVAAATGRLPEAARETDFTDLSGSFRIADGVAATEDLRMAAPLFRITGSGTVSLPDRWLDLRLVPTAVGTLEGQGSDFARAGLQVPVLIRGRFESPQVQPDFSGIATSVIEDPGRAADAVRRLREGGSARDVLDALTGGGAEPASPAPAPGEGEPQPRGAPADLLEQGLKQLFGR